MANPPPPYNDITGISRAVMKDNAQESITNYDGNARPGELVVDLEVDPPQLYVGNNIGALTVVATGGGGGNYANANAVAYGQAGWAGNIIPAANAVYSLGNVTNQWANLWVANNTIYLGGVPLGMSGNVLTVDGEPVLSNNSSLSITTAGNITGDYIYGNGAFLTGISGGGGGNLGNLSISNVTISPVTSNDPVIVQTVQLPQPWFYSTYGDLGVGTEEEYGESVAHDPGGNVFLTGGNENTGNVFVIKMDSGGNLLWQKNLSSANAMFASQLAVDSAGNVYATASDGTSASCYLIKIDTNGNQIWQLELQNVDALMGLETDASGNVFAHCRLYNDPAAGTVVKFDSSGSTIWQTQVKCNDGPTAPAGLALDAGGNVTITNGLDIVKLDPTGAALWQVRGNAVSYGINNYNDVAADPGGNIYIAGIGGTRNILKLDPTGSLVWASSIDPITTTRDPYDIAYDPINDAVIWSNYSNGPDYDLWLGSLSAASGNTNWNNQFNLADDYAWYYYIGTMLSVHDSVVAVAAYTYPIGASSADALTLQVPANGTGQGTYGSGTYSTLPGLAVPQAWTMSAGNSTVSTGSLTVNTSSSVSIANAGATYDNVPFIPGGDVAWQFTTTGTNGTIVFPDGTTQTTAFNTTANLAFTGSTTFTQAIVANLRTTEYSVRLGSDAGGNSPGTDSGVAIGREAGWQSQGGYSVAIGRVAGYLNQNVQSVAVGAQTGYSNQGSSATALGYNAAFSNQGAAAVAVGYQAGQQNQGQYGVAVGFNAGANVQGNNSVAVGREAAFNSQGLFSVAVGYYSAYTGQSNSAVAIGDNAAFSNQGPNAIAIGTQAGRSQQGARAIAIGFNSSYSSQGNDSISIGSESTYNGQSSGGVAIGYHAAIAGQGANSIAIGFNAAGVSIQANNSIVINATGTSLDNTTANTTVIKPVRNVTGGVAPGGFYQMYYNPTTGEIIVVTP